MAVTGILSMGNYTFPDVVQEYNDNFSNVVPLTTRVVGMDGGFDLDGDDPSPNQIGRVTFGFWLIASSRAAMEALRDDVRKLPSLGRQLITFQPTDTTDERRYIYGKVNGINMGQQKGQHTDLWQRVQLILQCPDPTWYSNAGFDHWPADGSIQADATYPLSYGCREVTFTTTPHTIAFSYNGTAIAFPEVALTATGTYSMTDWAIQQVIDGIVVDEISYNGTIQPSNEFTVSGKHKIAQWNGRRAFGSNLTYKHPDFLRFLPDWTSALKIVGTVNDGGFPLGGDITVRFWYRDRWR